MNHAWRLTCAAFIGLILCGGLSRWPGPSSAVAAEDQQQVAPQLNRELADVRERLRRVRAMYEPRKLNTRDHNAWQIMHSLIAFGCDTKVRRGGPEGPEVTAIGWLCFNGDAAGYRLLYADGEGVGARQGVGVQGHYGQFLAMLAQSRVSSDYPLHVSGRKFTVADLVEHEKLGCRSGTELTFKLIGLAHYLPSAARWKNRYGESWDLQRLVKEEIAQPIRGATCGGSHRLYGLSYAVHKRLRRGEPVDGQFRRAQIYLRDYHRYTFSLQNGDGSFSTAWFRGRGAEAGINQRLRTTGHIFEWLAFSLSDEELKHPRMVKAAGYLTGLLIDHPRHSWEIGPLGHALHGLVTYQQRLFDPPDAAGKGDATDKGDNDAAEETGPEGTSRRAAVRRSP